MQLQQARGAVGLRRDRGRQVVPAFSANPRSRAAWAPSKLAQTTRPSVTAFAHQKRPEDGAPNPAAGRSFEADSTDVVIRVLTARACQRVLMSLEEVDGWSAKWLNTYCATHPPLEGDKFISGLMLQAPAALVDPYTGESHLVYPTQLASGILAVRQELAGHVAKSLPDAVSSGSMAVLRRHLEEHTYVSGSAEPGPRPTYRDHRRQRRSKWQRLASN